MDEIPPEMKFRIAEFLPYKSLARFGITGKVYSYISRELLPKSSPLFVFMSSHDHVFDPHLSPMANVFISIIYNPEDEVLPYETFSFDTIFELFWYRFNISNLANNKDLFFDEDLKLFHWKKEITKKNFIERYDDYKDAKRFLISSLRKYDRKKKFKWSDRDPIHFLIHGILLPQIVYVFSIEDRDRLKRIWEVESMENLFLNENRVFHELINNGYGEFNEFIITMDDVDEGEENLIRAKFG